MNESEWSSRAVLAEVGTDLKSYDYYQTMLLKVTNMCTEKNTNVISYKELSIICLSGKE